MVKCTDCGFVTFRHRVTRELVEIGGDIRSSGEIPNTDNGRHKLYVDEPMCFVQAFPLQGEMEMDGSDAILMVIRKDRECDSYTEWQQGFTPKEHREMLDRKRMIEREDTRDKEQREWRADESKRDRTFRIQLVVVAGFFVILATFLGALYQRLIGG